MMSMFPFLFIMAYLKKIKISRYPMSSLYPEKDIQNYLLNIKINNPTRFLERIDVSLLSKNSRSRSDEIWHTNIAAYPEVKSLSISKKIPRDLLTNKQVWLMLKDSKNNMIGYEKLSTAR